MNVNNLAYVRIYDAYCAMKLKHETLQSYINGFGYVFSRPSLLKAVLQCITN